MKAMAIKRYGKHEILQLIESPVPIVNDHEILVKVHAASVNPIDFKVRDGKAKAIMSFSFPLILGHDFAGEVVGIGSKATKFKIGDRVYGRPRKDRIGAFAEYAAIHESEAALKPGNLSMEEAAGIPLVGLTAWQTLHDIVKLKAGQKLLIHAGAGGVGTFAIQLAKRMGAYVATTTSEPNFELVKSLGADEAINYRSEKFEERLHGYDAVFDAVGGDTLKRSFQTLKPGGIVASIAGMPDKPFAIQAGLGWAKTLLFSLISYKLNELAKAYQAQYRYSYMQPNGEQLQAITNLIEQGAIQPVVDRVYSFQDTQKAIEYVETGRAKGKVIISLL